MTTKLPVSPRTPVRIVPAWRVAEGQATPPAFFVRVPTPEDRADIDSELFIAGARSFSDGELHREMKRALVALIAPDEAMKAGVLIDEYGAALVAEEERRAQAQRVAEAMAVASVDGTPADATETDAGTPTPDPAPEAAPDPAAARLLELADEIERVEEFVLQHWERYRVMIANRTKRMNLYPLYVARRLLVGWEGLDSLEFKAGMDGRIKPDLWALLDERDRRAVGWEASGLLRLAPGQRGN